MEHLMKIQRREKRRIRAFTIQLPRKDSTGCDIWIKKVALRVDMMSDVKRVKSKEEILCQILVAQDRKQ